jgi:hypothetical protein
MRAKVMEESSNAHHFLVLRGREQYFQRRRTIFASGSTGVLLFQLLR